MKKCEVCFRHCALENGQKGACLARENRDGIIQPVFYGVLSSLALDPIEKKPLARFCPGTYILSAGSLGCNLRCPFCQNHEIAQPETNGTFPVPTKLMTPEELVELADRCRPRGSIGIAFTYNEPLVDYEFVRDTAKLAKKRDLRCVLVTNGTAGETVLDEILPFIDAMNIDLKGFTDRYYRDVLHGDRKMVMDFIRKAVTGCHVELTSLIVPGENDSDEEMLELSGWVAGLNSVFGNRQGRDIPLHISRFFPRHKMKDREPTAVPRVYELAEIARRNLRYVYTGNC